MGDLGRSGKTGSVRRILAATGIALASFASGCGDADSSTVDGDIERADAVEASDRFPSVYWLRKF